MMSAPPTRLPRLETVRRRLDRWRQTRPHAHAPLPPRLWAAAVGLVAEHGLYGTARALQLDYGALKRHVGAPDRQARDRVTSGFVELLPPPAREGCVIEVDGPHTRVRLRLTGLALPELAELTRLVVGAGS